MPVSICGELAGEIMIETFRGKSWRPDRSLAFFLKRNDYVLLDDIVLEARNKGAVLLTIPLNLISKFFDFVQLLGVIISGFLISRYSLTGAELKTLLVLVVAFEPPR